MNLSIASALVSVVAIGASLAPASSSSSVAPTVVVAQDKEMDALKKKFEQRYSEIVQLKSAGTVGETSDGYLDWVKGKSEEAAGLVDEENADRRRLYELIAKKENTTAEKVAQRNAQRNFEKARKGEWLKKGGEWVQK